MKKILIAGSCSPLAANFIRNAFYEGTQYKLSAFDRLNSVSAIDNLYVNNNLSFNIADMNDEHIFKRIVEYEKPDVLIDFSTSKKTTALEKQLSKIEKYIVVSNYFTKSKIDKESMELDNKFILRLPKLYGPRQVSDKTIPSMIKALVTQEQVEIDVNPMQDEYWMHIFDAIKNIQTMIDTNTKELNAYGTQCFNYLDIQQRITKLSDNQDVPVSFTSVNSIPEELILTSDRCHQQFIINKGLDQTIAWYQNNQWIFK